MYTPSLKEFLKLASRGNVIPVYKQINADMDTPVSAFLKLKKQDFSFLLESVEGQEKIARYSFLGSNPSLVFKSKGRDIEIYDGCRREAKKYQTATDPLEEIKKIMVRFKPVVIPGLPRFFGGLVGYMGYDVVRFFERIPKKNKDSLNLPDCYFILTDTLIIFDHVNHTMKLVSNCILPMGSAQHLSPKRLKGVYLEAVDKIKQMELSLAKPLKIKNQNNISKKYKITSNLKKSEFLAMVYKAKSYIRKGDIIQVVLSQRFQRRFESSPFDVYRALRSLNPSPYMFFLQFKDVTLIGSSPEIHVRCEERIARIRPIAGTRPRGLTEINDMRMQKELIGNVKEKAEHIMLVDLARNDLGRVCLPGRVRVTEFMTVERYSHVMHLVSEVQGLLRHGCDIYDLLRATFPAGTVSGSPKIRAMEIIEELENTQRGPYAGCVGYFSFSQNIDSCITIRTIVIKDKTAFVQAGAGIVADSIPANEYLETVNKAKALFEAMERTTN